VTSPYFYHAVKDKTSIYILGTMHVGFKLADFHPKVIKELDGAQAVALEANEDVFEAFSEIKQKRAAEYVTKFTNVPYEHLEARFSARAWKNLKFTLKQDEVKKILKARNISVEPLKLNPTVIIAVVKDLLDRTQLYAFSDDVKDGWKNLNLQWSYFDSSNLVDKEILSRAHANATHVIALDVVSDDLVNLLTDFEKISLNFLESFFGDSAKRAARYNEIREAYQQGKEVDLLKDLEEMGLTDTLIRKRNEEWLPRLLKIEEKNIFMAVGAGHLLGKHSFLKMLETAGFQVTKIPLKEKP
jgi:uncharacterized protein YbaP (TraB family)